jgi:hypothetical protein
MILFRLQAPTLKQAEQQLLGPYVDSLEGAKWAAAKGPSIVPVLSQMLDRVEDYKKRDDGTMGAFPFNTIWALGHIKGDASRAALNRYIRRTQDITNRTQAMYAIAAHDLRARKKSDSYGVLGSTSPAGKLYAQASENSRVLKTMKPGQPVRLLKEAIENPKEEGARGGPTVYDYVELVPSGPRGYVQRAGDIFSPFF